MQNMWSAFLVPQDSAKNYQTFQKSLPDRDQTRQTQRTRNSEGTKRRQDELQQHYNVLREIRGYFIHGKKSRLLQKGENLQDEKALLETKIMVEKRHFIYGLVSRIAGGFFTS